MREQRGEISTDRVTWSAYFLLSFPYHQFSSEPSGGSKPVNLFQFRFVCDLVKFLGFYFFPKTFFDLEK